MAGPVFVTLTTSCARPPTESVCDADTLISAVKGGGVSRQADMMTRAATTAAFISLIRPSLRPKNGGLMVAFCGPAPCRRNVAAVRGVSTAGGDQAGGCLRGARHRRLF